MSKKNESTTVGVQHFLRSCIIKYILLKTIPYKTNLPKWISYLTSIYESVFPWKVLLPIDKETDKILEGYQLPREDAIRVGLAVITLVLLQETQVQILAPSQVGGLENVAVGGEDPLQGVAGLDGPREV